MASYRIYRVEDGGRLALAEPLTAASDQEAVAAVKGLFRSGMALELWRGGSLIGRISKAGLFEAHDPRGADTARA